MPTSPLTTILFDLDGTLLPMDQEVFTKYYFGLLARKLAPLGYEKDSLVAAIWKGTGAMVKNDGSKSNEEAFWNTFSGITRPDARDDMPVFEDFYRNDFQQAKASCGFNLEAKKTVDELKRMGFRVSLATNPIFPAIATESRIRWAGLEPDDFEAYTTYENSRFCKPNPKYFEEVCNSLGVTPTECLMVGNDMDEDTPAASLGMKVFILTDCLINKSGRDLGEFPHGGFSDLMDYVKSVINGSTAP
ncbi:MAG: HAD family hydrolase [Ruminococcus sp.]|nr:HAD family hydrolase [Ruminococcus sp.]